MSIETFRNPLSDGPAPDPFILYHEGYYYALYTEVFGISVCRSRRLDTVMRDEKKVVFSLGDEVQGSIWAPELHYVPAYGRWYIYACGTREGWDFGTMRMFCLESADADPFGDYHFKGFTDPDHLAIDETVLVLPDGALYTAFSRFVTIDGIFTQVVTLAPMETPWRIAPDNGHNRLDLTRPAYDWEWQGATDDNAAHINEGPIFLWDGAHLSLVYSASACWSEGYCLGLVRYSGAELSPAALLDPANWHKSRTPIFRAANEVYGPGHNSFFTAADGSRWIAYHGMYTPDAGMERRFAYAQPMTVAPDGTPVLGEPLARETDIPLPR